MRGFESGVLYYTKGLLKMEISFPEDRTICQWCPFCRSEDSMKRHKCILTGEYLVYPFITIGAQCPIQFKKEEKL